LVGDSEIDTLLQHWVDLRIRTDALPSWSRQEAQFFAAQDGLGAAGGSEFVKSAGTVGFDGVF
jgi:hypothetical protein